MGTNAFGLLPVLNTNGLLHQLHDSRHDACVSRLHLPELCTHMYGRLAHSLRRDKSGQLTAFCPMCALKAYKLHDGGLERAGRTKG